MGNRQTDWMSVCCNQVEMLSSGPFAVRTVSAFPFVTRARVRVAGFYLPNLFLMLSLVFARPSDCSLAVEGSEMWARLQGVGCHINKAFSIIFPNPRRTPPITRWFLNRRRWMKLKLWLPSFILLIWPDQKDWKEPGPPARGRKRAFPSTAGW